MKNLMMPWMMFLMDKAGDDKSGGGQTGSEGGNKDGKGKGEAGDDDEGGNADDKGDQGDKGGGEVDLSKQPEEVQKLIKKLRAENAQTRTKNKELGASSAKLKKALVEAGVIDDDSIPPEEQVKTLSATTTALGVRNAILEAAIEHGVGKEQSKYFTFLVQSKLEELGEDEEMSEEVLAELAEEAKGARKASAKSTSVNGKKDKKSGEPAPEGDDNEITLEHFVSMNVLQKSELYNKKPELYERLKGEAKTKRIFI